MEHFTAGVSPSDLKVDVGDAWFPTEIGDRLHSLMEQTKGNDSMFLHFYPVVGGLVLVVNLIGFRVTQEMNLCACL